MCESRKTFKCARHGAWDGWEDILPTGQQVTAGSWNPGLILSLDYSLLFIYFCGVSHVLPMCGFLLVSLVSSHVLLFSRLSRLNLLEANEQLSIVYGKCV